MDSINKRVRAAIKLVVVVVWLGYLMVWIMIPTNIYTQTWGPAIQKAVDSTYFGSQGISLLIFSLPILFVAVLGCVYLQLGRTTNDNKLESNGKKHDLLATWRKLMLVRGPLGIVSGIELAFLIMLVALIIWSTSTYLYIDFKNDTPEAAARDGDILWQSKLRWAAYRLGAVGNICLALLFFPVARGSSVLPLFGLTSEGSIKYHIWLGHLVMFLFTAHGLAYIIYWIAANKLSEMLRWQEAHISNLAGELSLLAGLGLWATTFLRIRRKMFELFFYTHYLYILFMVFFVFHVGFSYTCITLPGFYLFLVDRYLRFLQSRRSVRLVSARVLPCDTLELNFSKSPGLSYNPTSILFMNVPSISKLQWHPFTISSNSNLEPDNLSVIIKSEGSWSKKLYQMLSSASSIDRLEVSVEGPYGPASTHFLRHDTLVMVSGGSGITPSVSIIREIIFAGTVQKFKTPQILLIAAFKHSTALTMLNLLLPMSGTPSTLSNLQLKIEAYVTRETEPATDDSKRIQAKWFKPYATDAPISAILGPRSWLWLSAIISSSFIIFLIIIGLITRYYIYPIDQNTDRIFSYAVRASINMLVLCVCIAVTASAAVFWNKRKKVREAKQIQNMEMSRQVLSPTDSWPHDSDRELESLPHQSIVQATNVHYGERPDLKNILLERKGSSVGVLVCGPKKLRHEVAAICSSGLSDNLHFESISFCW